MTTPSPSAEPTNSGPLTARAAPRDPALDGLRGVAILLVFLFHYGGGLRAHNPAVRALGYLTQAGWIGVDLFFALSGFLITGILLEKVFREHAFQSVIEPGLPEKTGADSPTSDRQSLRLRPPAIPQSGNLRSAGAPGLDSETWVLAGPTTPSTAPETPPTGILSAFYARRALRIVPLYAAALLACAVAALATGASLAQLRPLLLYAAFLQNIPPFATIALHTPPPLPLFHLWSLAVEEQFYLLWPLVLVALRQPRRALHFSIAVFVAGCFFRAILFAPGLLPWHSAASFATSLPTQAGALALGCAFALYWASPTPPGPYPTVLSSETKRLAKSGSLLGTRSPARNLAKPLLAALLGLLLVLLGAIRTHSFLLNSRTAFFVTLPGASILSAALVALALVPGPFRTFLSARLLAALGRISYGFYVFHILLEPLFDRLCVSLTHSHAGFPYQIARLLTAFPITVLAAWLSYHLLERPFLARDAPGCSVHAVAYNSRPAR